LILKEDLAEVNFKAKFLKLKEVVFEY